MGGKRTGADPLPAGEVSAHWMTVKKKKPVRLEKAITNDTLAWLKTLPACKVIKKHQTMYDERGTPDIMGCIRGRMFVIEMKRPGEYPTPIQLHRLQEWAEAGAVAFWADSLEQVKKRFREEGLC